MNNGTHERILVVDDEPSIVDAVATALRYEGYEVEQALTGRQALSAATTFDPHLIVLDWMLPDVEGIEVGRRLRDRGFKTAILFPTAKDATENKVEALRAGGDDYVTKPFSLAELVARVQAILRRTSSELPGDVLSFADLTLDEMRHEVFRGETQVPLTATEFNLLRYFLLNPRRVLSKPQILQNVWRYDFGGNSNVVETYVSYLRKKLDSAGPPLIRTVRQVGYMLDAEPREGEPDAVRYFTAPAQSGGERYRVRASIEVENPSQLLVIATSLHTVDATLHRLFLIELLVTLAVLAALVALALWVVRIGLRPLVAIERTAAAIGAG